MVSNEIKDIFKDSLNNSMTLENKYLMALSYVKGLGPIKLKKYLAHFESVAEAWQLSEKEKNGLPGLHKNIASQIGSNQIMDLVEKELAFCGQNNIVAATFLDDNYPQLLKECVDAPAVVFYKGRMNLENGKFVGVVGTRKMTSRGKDFVHELIDGLKNQPITIVSGLAMGIDAEAHCAAMQNDLQTIGVLGHGLHQIYPRINHKIGVQMQEKGGLFSEFSSFHQGAPENFLKRNRIIAALSHATVVIESAYKGGALSTARHANNYNREVFAVPGRTNDVTAAGCHHLIKSHQAFLITSADDLLKSLNISPKKKMAKIQKELFLELSAPEQLVYDLLKTRGKMHIDLLASSLELTSYQLMPILLDMELKNLIEPLPGKFYDIR